MLRLPAKVRVLKSETHTTVIDSDTDQEIQGISKITWDLKDGKPPHVRIVFFASVESVDVEEAQQRLPLEPQDQK